MHDEADELYYMSAAEALRLFGSRDLSPVELLDAVIARAEEIENSVNPFADRYFDDARRQARASEAAYRKGRARRLEGLPLLVKDSSAIAGRRSTEGSLIFAERIDRHTDPAVDRLMRAGANVFARSTCPEFCWLFTCHSRLWGVTRNPWRLDVTPGGSSGGSAAALAAGATTLATGSDSTGSTRQPAAQCGVVGYKPPCGRNPLEPRASFDPYVSVGPMARSVEDTILMQNVMSGPHPLDHNSLTERVRIPLEPGAIDGMNIAFSMDLGNYTVARDVQREIRVTLAALADAGARVTEVEVDWAAEAIRLATLSQEFLVGGLLDYAMKNHADKVSAYVPELRETSAAVTREHYQKGLELAGEVWAAHLGPLFEHYDALLTPTVACPEVPAENRQQDLVSVDGREVTDTETAMTVLFNMYNRCPVLSVPAGMTDRGLPVGMQIVGRPCDDATVFRIGRAVERHRPWAYRIPDLSRDRAAAG